MYYIIKLPRNLRTIIYLYITYFWTLIVLFSTIKTKTIYICVLVYVYAEVIYVYIQRERLTDIQRS